MKKLLALVLGVGGAANCAQDTSPGEVSVVKVEPGKEDSSAEAVFLHFDFDGELLTDASWNAARQVESQLLYTIGQLNGELAVGRLDNVNLRNVQSTREGTMTRIRYTATIPVAWSRRTPVPNEFTLRLPRDVSRRGLENFTEKYSHDCVDWGAHDVTSGSMWYYYRPEARRCNLAATDIQNIVATVSPSPTQTTGRFPEYDRVWSDGVFRVVAVFGKYEDGATSGDAGISAYSRFINEMKRVLRDADSSTNPATLPPYAGVETPEVIFNARFDAGHEMELVTLLVDNVRTAGRSFDQRYADLSATADLIIYNGHAGLGSNIRALARKGRWTPGQYSIVFMNGCDTYAYVDSALWDAHAAVNPDDPEGTKYLDLVSNAMPSFFREMPRATLALIKGLIAYDEPRTYEQIFRDMDYQQIVLVSGEHDNTFTPGGGGEPDPTWNGISDSGTLARGAVKKLSTETLPAGDYVFEMTGTGDADLYVRIGSEPTRSEYDCRPYRSNSEEQCKLSLPSPATIHVMIDGYRQSNYELNGRIDG